MGRELLGRLVEIKGGQYDGDIGRCFSVNEQRELCWVRVTITELVIVVNKGKHLQLTIKNYTPPISRDIKLSIDAVSIWTQPTA